MFNKLKRATELCRNTVFNIIDRPVIILLYHRVANLDNDPEMLAVSIDNFEQHIKFLAEHFPILRFNEDWDMVNKTSFVITFDDGYADNLINALPVLNKYEVPATFFISSGCVDAKKEFWWDLLGQLLLNRNVDYPEAYCKYPTTNEVQRFELYRNMLLKLKASSAEERTSILQDISDWSGIKTSMRENYRPVTLDELTQMHQSPLVTIGSHTVNHVQLSSLPREKQYEEIFVAHSELEAVLNDKLEVFSFPFGNIEDYNSDTLQICRQLGFSKVAANYPGQAHSWSDKMQLPRQLARNWTLPALKKQLFRFKYL